LVNKAIREHAEKVGDTASELNRAVASMVKGDEASALDAIKRLVLSEKEADRMEEMISEELSKGDMESKEREDLMHLIRRMDYVADWAKESGMNLQLIIEAKIKIPVQLWKRYAEMTIELEKATKSLRMSIDALGVDMDAVISYERSVKVSEHTLDEMYFSTKKEIFTMADLDPRAIYLMRDLLHGIENSADKCEDSADILHILVTSQRHKAQVR
jgi:predicted phosphate transport protein (TIGR00153 family)